MNRREKILMAAVGGVLVLFAALWAKDTYFKALDGLDDKIASRARKLKTVKEAVKDEKDAKGEWCITGEQTLSMNPHEARLFLFDELLDLARASGLPTISPKEAPIKTSRVISGKTDGLRRLQCEVKAQVKLGSIREFLFGLHRQPFLVRCTKMTLTPVRPKTSSRSTKPTTPVRMTAEKFDMKLTLETPILPPVKSDPSLRKLEVAVLAKDKRKEWERTMLASAGDYSRVKRELFEPPPPPVPMPGKAVATSPTNNQDVQPARATNLTWRRGSNVKTQEIYFAEGSKLPDKPVATPTGASWKPPKVEVGKTYVWRVDGANSRGTTRGDVWKFTVNAEVAEPPEPPKPPEPKKSVHGDMRVDRLFSSPNGQVVVVQKPPPPGKPTPPGQPETKVTVGEKLHFGKLIYVHPRGVVTQHEDDGTLYFHRVHEIVNKGKVLVPEVDPEVYYELQKLAERAEELAKAGERISE